jgi:hypothetical protein
VNRASFRILVAQLNGPVTFSAVTGSLPPVPYLRITLIHR